MTKNSKKIKKVKKVKKVKKYTLKGGSGPGVNLGFSPLPSGRDVVTPPPKYKTPSPPPEYAYTSVQPLSVDILNIMKCMNTIPSEEKINLKKKANNIRKTNIVKAKMLNTLSRYNQSARATKKTTNATKKAINNSYKNSTNFYQYDCNDSFTAGEKDPICTYDGLLNFVNQSEYISQMQCDHINPEFKIKEIITFLKQYENQPASVFIVADIYTIQLFFPELFEELQYMTPLSFIKITTMTGSMTDAITKFTIYVSNDQNYVVEEKLLSNHEFNKKKSIHDIYLICQADNVHKVENNVILDIIDPPPTINGLNDIKVLLNKLSEVVEDINKPMKKPIFISSHTTSAILTASSIVSIYNNDKNNQFVVSLNVNNVLKLFLFISIIRHNQLYKNSS